MLIGPRWCLQAGMGYKLNNGSSGLQLFPLGSEERKPLEQWKSQSGVQGKCLWSKTLRIVFSS